jgi:Calx-beta domain
MAMRSISGVADRLRPRSERLNKAFRVLISLTLFDASAALAEANPQYFACTDANAIFVDGAGGNDANAGTMEAPTKTIAAGMSLAVSTGLQAICVATGSYPEGVSIAGRSISLYGQYDAQTWTHSTSSTSNVLGVFALYVGGEFHFEWFHVNARDASSLSGESSYGILVYASSPFYIRYNTINAGLGGLGQPPAEVGSIGVDGGSGTDGSAGSQTTDVLNNGGAGGTSSCGATGGNGGAGGYAANGAKGGDGVGFANSGGAGGQVVEPFPLFDNDGLNGLTATTSGAAGNDGSPSTSLAGGVSAGGDGYAPPIGTSATTGSSGAAGGGGGGGGGPYIAPPINLQGTGDGGGGGGAGGCGGSPGQNGGSGGGSFGIFAVGSDVIIDSDFITVSAGGEGFGGYVGYGGGGGGAGGEGSASNSAYIGTGGKGGDGAAGGKGGDGAGGDGGPSIGIYRSAGEISFGTIRYSLPSQGASGGTGNKSSTRGFSGLVQNDWPENRANAASPTLSVASVSIPMAFAGNDVMLVQVSVTPPTNDPVSVDYATADDTAVIGVDYVATSGTLTFDEWQTTQSISIPILGADSTPKDFVINLSNAMGASISIGAGTETINYDVDIIFRNGFE